MENEKTNKTAEQEKSGEKDTGFESWQNCCEGMPFNEDMAKKWMKGFKDMPGFGSMAEMCKGCCAPRKSEKA